VEKTQKDYQKELAVVNKINLTRLIAALIVAPAVPLLMLSITYWIGTGSIKWITFFFLFGYAYFALLGLPVAGLLVKEKDLNNCLLAGGVTSIAPIILLGSLSMFSSNTVFEPKVILSLGALFVAGAIGGFVFWLIAFYKSSKLSVESD
jgi:hypothetical protein